MPKRNHDFVIISSTLIFNHAESYYMPQYDYRPLNNMLIRVGVDKLFNSLGTGGLRAISERLMVYDYGLSDCYARPDILCKILKGIYGKSYISLIESI